MNIKRSVAVGVCTLGVFAATLVGGFALNIGSRLDAKHAETVVDEINTECVDKLLDCAYKSGQRSFVDAINNCEKKYKDGVIDEAKYRRWRSEYAYDFIYMNEYNPKIFDKDYSEFCAEIQAIQDNAPNVQKQLETASVIKNVASYGAWGASALTAIVGGNAYLNAKKKEKAAAEAEVQAQEDVENNSEQL